MYYPETVIQIISGSRSGSSLLKRLLTRNSTMSCLAGEEEPYFTLTSNGFGFTSESDAFTEMNNPELFRSFISNELHSDSIKMRWETRLRLQFKGERLARLLNDTDSIVRVDDTHWLRSHGVLGHYDSCAQAERKPFQEMVYEMPPYVFPTQQLNTSTLLLKAPYNLFRPGVLEQVYPKAKFIKIYLVRNPAATINGLIAGWEANYGFHKHLTEYGWWKFEAPPGWENYIHKSTAERAWYQWQAGVTMLQSQCGPSDLLVRFEDVLENPNDVLSKIEHHVGINLGAVSSLPVVMATEFPERYRWKKRASAILPLLMRSVETIKSLGYGDTSKWI